MLGFKRFATKLNLTKFSYLALQTLYLQAIKFKTKVNANTFTGEENYTLNFEACNLSVSTLQLFTVHCVANLTIGTKPTNCSWKAKFFKHLPPSQFD